MADEKNEEGKKKDSESGGKGKKKRSKMFIVTIVCLVVAVVVILLLWGMTPADYLEVSDVMGDTDSYVGDEIEVQGTVRDYDQMNDTFVLEDGDDKLLVHYPKAMPSNFEVGKDVVAKGQLETSDDYSGHSFVLRATSVTIGCASKYE